LNLFCNLSVKRRRHMRHMRWSSCGRHICRHFLFTHDVYLQCCNPWKNDHRPLPAVGLLIHSQSIKCYVHLRLYDLRIISAYNTRCSGKGLSSWMLEDSIIVVQALCPVIFRSELVQVYLLLLATRKEINCVVIQL
jgi:hypothetical protein